MGKNSGNLEDTNTGSGNGPSCRTALIIPFDNDTLYLVGTTVGLFGTRDLDGVNTVWQQIGFEEFGSTIVEDLSFRSSDNLLVVATYGNGVYQINLSSPNILLSDNNLLTDEIELNIFLILQLILSIYHLNQIVIIGGLCIMNLVLL